MKKLFSSLQYKILALSLVLIIIPLLTVGSFAFTKTLEISKKNFSLSNLNTVKQIGTNIEFIIQDVHDISLYLIQDEEIRKFFMMSDDDPEQVKNMLKIRILNSLVALIGSKEYIDSIYIEGFNGLCISTAGIGSAIDQEICSRLEGLKGGALWMPNKVTNYNNNTTEVFSMLRLINNITRIPEKLAILQINVDKKEITSIHSDKTVDKKGSFYIIDSQNRIVSSSNLSETEELMRDIIDFNSFPEQKTGYYETTLEGRDYLITYYRIDGINWILVSLIPIKILLRENAFVQTMLVSSIVISFIICVALALLFSRKILLPMNQLSSLMEEVERENFDARIEVKGNDEIALLGRSFNSMLKRLKELMHQVYLVKIQQQEAELKALQAQINPHFLYNSLDTIYWMSRMEKAFETSKLVEALSRLFRLSLNKGSEFTTVRNEVEHLKNYIIIQQKRYEEMIQFSINVDEDTLDCKVVKLVLQPIVENAIYHGIEKKGEQGCISIEIKRQNNLIIYIVRDNGSGVDVKEINKLLNEVQDNNRGFAIKNVNDRIKLYFGPKYGLKFSSAPGQGTTVTVVQPYTKYKGGQS